MALVKKVFTKDELVSLQYKYYKCKNIVSEIPKMQDSCNVSFKKDKKICMDCDIYKYCFQIAEEKLYEKWGF